MFDYMTGHSLCFYILINGRLEAYGINSVLCDCVLIKSSHHNWC